MAPRSDLPDLTAAWRALNTGAGESASGWRTIPLDQADFWRLTAGVRFPGREEAILVGLSSASSLQNRDLPEGAGFAVERLSGPPATGASAWFALTRAPAASLELFTAMANDVSALIIGGAGLAEPQLLQKFLGRVRAWQQFMSKRPGAALGAEAELGLLGELAVLEHLIAGGLSALAAIEAWQGPLEGLHDFEFGSAGLEVKSTLAASGFPAKISSLEQLDEEVRCPIFLAGVRVCLQADGETLPGCIDRIRDIADRAQARSAFDMRLLHGGYQDEHAEDYTRRFRVVSMRLIKMGAGVPRLSRSQLPPAIRSASYELDLDQISAPTLTIADALSDAGQPIHDA